jgi:single-stranded-DNA-specific exonuclease
MADYPLHEALKHCDDLLISHGGHQMAAGFRVRPDRIDAFRDRIETHAKRHFANGQAAPKIVLDAETPLSALTLKLMNEIDRLEPYGSANERPIFLAGELQVVGEPRKVGQNERHLMFRVAQAGTQMRAVAFGMTERLEELMSQQGRCCLAFVPKVNEWQGRRTVEMEVVDFQPGDKATLA